MSSSRINLSDVFEEIELELGSMPDFESSLDGVEESETETGWLDNIDMNIIDQQMMELGGSTEGKKRKRGERGKDKKKRSVHVPPKRGPYKKARKPYTMKSVRPKRGIGSYKTKTRRPPIGIAIEIQIEKKETWNGRIL